ncbi:MAG TPA: hypothetical protein VE991_02745 [Acidimicrobiales bacterium]|nr:hypothetical protein [Acidimicrobiales bacterium]
MPFDDAMAGEFVGGAHRPVATFRSGRTCEHPGCTTRLSIYNSRPCCALHDFDASLLHFRSARHDDGTAPVVPLPVATGDRLAPTAPEPPAAKSTRRASPSHAA